MIKPKMRKQHKPRNMEALAAWKRGHKVVPDGKKKQSKNACRERI